MPIKSVKMKISKNKKNAFFSHVPRTTQPKNQVPRSKGVTCSRYFHNKKYRCFFLFLDISPNFGFAIAVVVLDSIASIEIKTIFVCNNVVPKSRETSNGHRCRQTVSFNNFLRYFKSCYTDPRNFYTQIYPDGRASRSSSSTQTQ